jgi:DNA-directed RNA polymerase specialized sigma24 family protein
MSTSRQDTGIGHGDKRFDTTEWTQIFLLQTSDAKRQNLIVDSLIRKYWNPVYFYLCQKKYDSEQAKDLTQGFFHDVVLNRDLLKRADSSKGRFRTFLLTALNCYLTDAYRKENAKCRRPNLPAKQLQVETLAQLPEPISLSPDQLFHYLWAVDLIDAVIQQTRKYCDLSGKTIHWKLFESHILNPIQNQTPAPSVKSLCVQYHIESEDKASNMIITVKRCFRRILEDHLKQYVQTNSGIDEEIRDLFHLLEQFGAG